MLAVLALSGLLVGLPASPVPDVDSVEAALRALSSATAAERTRGERWLASHLVAEDFPRLAEAAADGASEVRVRIARALGAEDRHLELAVLLAGDDVPALAELGRDAVHELAGRWVSGLGRPFAVDRPDRQALRKALETLRTQWPARRYRLTLEGSLDEVVERFARLADLPLSLAVDPFATETPPGGLPAGKAIEGTWDELLLRIAVAFGVDLEGALVPDENGATIPAFVCFRPREGVDVMPVVEVLTDWCRRSLGEGDLARRAAGALAGSGWPAAMKWLDRRYRRHGDAAALEGLLLAAARDRVALSLQRTATVRDLLARADGAADARGRGRVAYALAQLPPVALDGARIDEVLAEGWSELAPASLSVRLVALEGVAGDGAAVERALRELLARPASDIDAARRLQGLRAWSACADGRDLELAGVRELWNDARGPARAEELVRLLLDAGTRPPADWDDPTGAASLPPSARAGLLEWNLALGRGAVAAAYLDELTRWKSGWPTDGLVRSDQEAVARVLRRWVRRGQGDRVGRWLEALGASEDGTARAGLHRLVLLADAPVPDSALRDLTSLQQLVPREAGTFPEGDEEVLGVLGSRSVPTIGGPAKAALFARLGRMLARRATSDLDGTAAGRALAGLERCADELLSRGRDLEVELIASEVRGLLRRFPDHPLAREVLGGGWPRGPSSEAEDLALLDRSLD